MTKHIKKATSIIKKLKRQIAKNGYVENLGENELRDFNTYIFNELSCSEANKAYQALVLAIEGL